jgi:hypothetical protein
MAKVAIEIGPIQVESIIKQMSPAEQREVERKLWAIRMDTLVTKMRKNAKKNKITAKEIQRICEEVRQELYEKRNR